MVKIAFLWIKDKKTKEMGKEFLAKVERFNGKIKNKLFKHYLFKKEEDLKEKLTPYLNSYNFEIKLRQLNYQTPGEYLKQKYNFSI